MPEASNCQNAIERLSGLHRQQSRRKNSSSFTQSEVPLLNVGLPFVVRDVILPVWRSSVYKLLSRTYPTRRLSGDSFANISVEGFAPPPSFVSLPLGMSS